jgi:hypothetical protein
MIMLMGSMAASGVDDHAVALGVGTDDLLVRVNGAGDRPGV